MKKCKNQSNIPLKKCDFNSYYLEMRLSEMIYTEEELQQEIRAKESWRDLYWEECEKNKKLEEKIRFLEECLDRKEKLNEKYRKEIEKLKSTYVYDSKQVRDVC